MKPKSVGFPLDGKKLRYTRGNGEKSRSILAEIAMHFNVMMLQRQKRVRQQFKSHSHDYAKFQVLMNVCY